MRLLRTAILTLGLLVLQGCAAVALTAASIAGSAGVDHTLSGIVYKTFTIPVDDLESATLTAFDRMDIEVTEKKRSEEGWEIKGKAGNRVIEVQLETLTKRATRMRVVAGTDDLFFTDSATATEIIIQTAQTVAEVASRE